MENGKSRMDVYESINGITAEEVYKITSENPLLFIRYFEAIIDRDGLVYFSCPSHERKVLQLAKEQFGLTDQMVYENDWCGLDIADCYGYILVWYNNIAGTPNESQQETINKLRDYKLLDKDYSKDSLTLERMMFMLM